MYHLLPLQRPFRLAARAGLLALLLAPTGSACLRAAAWPQRTPLYQTDVTLTSLDCDAVIWRRIFFHDEHDTVVAQADSGPPLGGTIDAGGGCAVHFSTALPRARSYVIDNGSRRSAPVSLDELRANHFQMKVPLR